ncbi:hypothetical protein [Dactylosporangium salmoneum]|uniref:hypothetical protein n=1 Tax=Dactylosporangium salmoneum TaxID=53361 RepID=UPI0031D05215
MPSDRRAVMDRRGRTAGILTLCALLITGAAACAPAKSPAASAALATAASESPSAEPSTSAAVPEASTAAPEASTAAPEASAPVPGASTPAAQGSAAPVAAKTTVPAKPPTPTTAPAQAGGAHVKSASMHLLRTATGSPGDWCGPTSQVPLEFTLYFDGTGPGTATAVVHDSDGLSVTLGSYPNQHGQSGGGGHFDVHISKDRPKRTVEFWVEVTSPNHVSSPHAAFAVDCAGVLDK